MTGRVSRKTEIETAFPCNLSQRQVHAATIVDRENMNPIGQTSVLVDKLPGNGKQAYRKLRLRLMAVFDNPQLAVFLLQIRIR